VLLPFLRLSLGVQGNCYGLALWFSCGHLSLDVAPYIRLFTALDEWHSVAVLTRRQALVEKAAALATGRRHAVVHPARWAGIRVTIGLEHAWLRRQHLGI
jgi:hypothetical protein